MRRNSSVQFRQEMREATIVSTEAESASTPKDPRRKSLISASRRWRKERSCTSST
jgi:hypothetical protein